MLTTIAPLTNVDRIGSGGGGGVSQADHDSLRADHNTLSILVHTKQSAAQVSAAITAGTSTLASQSQLTTGLAGKVDNAAHSGLVQNVSDILSGASSHEELTVANEQYAVGDNTVDAYLTSKVDANNRAGWRVRNTAHSAGSQTLSFDAYDTSASQTQSNPTQILTMNWNPDTSKKLVMTDVLACGTIPLATSTGDIHCQRVYATTLLSVGGVNLRGAGTHLQTQSWVGASGSYGQTHPTFTGSASTDVTSTSYVDILSATFTPSSSSSVLNVKVGNMGCHLVSTAGNAFPNGSLWELRFEIGGVACGRRYSHYAGAGYLMNNSTEEFGSLSNLFGRYINSGTSALTIKIQGLSTTGSTTEYLKVYCDNAILECTEIQA